MRRVLPRALIHAGHIQARVRQLGAAIAADLAAESRPPPMVVALFDGSFCFVADLARALPLVDVHLRFMSASSYRSTASTGTVALGVMPEVAGRSVLVVDDILDTGRTLRAALDAVTAAGAAKVRSCVLLDKPARRIAAGAASADYIGFTIPDVFVVGYGLDWDGRYRHLPDICVLEPD